MQQSKKLRYYYFGILAEYIAAIFMVLKLHIPIKRRFKTKYGEIDLIFYRNNVVKFVEVKARYKIYEYDSVLSATQLERIKNASYVFLNENKIYQNCQIQFDLIIFSISPLKLLHIKNIF